MLSHFSHLTLYKLMDYSPLGSSVHGILQARILEWSSIHESLEEACMVHGLDVDEVFGQIQAYLNSKKA